MNTSVVPAHPSGKIADYDNQLARIDTRLVVLSWMAGTNLALTAGVLWRLLAH